MELVEILDLFFQCSLTEKKRTSFMYELLDNMMIEGSKNPFENSTEDSLNRIFLGAHAFPRTKAKYIYLHKNEARLSSFIRNMGDDIVYNIETCIQKIDDSYEPDETCYRLSELVFEKLYVISDMGSVPKKLDKNVNEDNETIFQLAQSFCIDYEDEIGLLPLCQIAANLNPMHNYVRQMYTDYCKCNDAVRKKILAINDCESLEFRTENWIDRSLDTFELRIHERKLSTVNFLYDGAKYFHRAFERYSGYQINFDPWVFDSLSKSEKNFCGIKIKRNLYGYLSDYLDLLTKDDEINEVPPLDSMWDYCCDEHVTEPEVTYWVCMAIIAVSSLLGDKDGDTSDDCDANLGDAEVLINTEEDMYLYALFELFKLYRGHEN